jgi:hypothetical protein
MPYLEELRTAADPSVWPAAVEQGQRMSLAETIAYAVGA